MKTKRIILIVLLIVSCSYFLIYSSRTQFSHYMPMMQHAYPSNWNYLDLFFLWLGLSSFVLLVIDLVPKVMNRDLKAINLLNSRLSNGELSIEEYKIIKKEIS